MKACDNPRNAHALYTRKRLMHDAYMCIAKVLPDQTQAMGMFAFKCSHEVRQVSACGSHRDICVGNSILQALCLTSLRNARLATEEAS